ncbi:unnamed protein product (macronuclear) [Paramecium tetraurelia]|uniref:Uncharacterized protein n=1 Tax=Paramecium tetraurelia TaxID=5888 RepID=A0BGW8_PARTE|nr:uncharacterized protein GSPATT00028820001 [Paramecium tetraurelia]CAK57785.1 unnamed protein product [Paramecium tetraurelia]|eukprot:XP_001425183.1 hypothetical protein (macronuclear) [Paramecium tetraurelia strain d4-2]
MTTCRGPKIKFELMQQKMDQFSLTDDEDQIDLMQQHGERKVSFADSSIIFLHYQDEEIFNFRSRLKAQIQQKHLEPYYLNPSLCYSNLQNKRKSCFKEFEIQSD